MSERPRTFAETWDELTAAVMAVYEPPLIRALDRIDRQLRRWPWLYRRLGGDA